MNKKFLIIEYIKKKKSSYQIARQVNCWPMNIIRQLRKFGIPVRTKQEAGKNRPKPNKETRNKISRALKGKFKGKIHPNCGKGYRFKGEKNPNFKGGKPKCKDCNKVLSGYKSIRCRECYDNSKKGIRRPEHSKIMMGHSVSKETRTKLSIKHKEYCKRHINYFKGKNNPAWIDGRSYVNYPKEFKYLRKIIRKRDGYKCQRCGIIEKLHLVKYKQTLEIHHIDYNRENCKVVNLITLCKKCNLKANKDRDYWFAFYTYLIDSKKGGN